MTLSKKLLFSSILVSTVTFISAVSLKNFDTNLLTPYIERAEHEFSVAEATLQYLDHGSREISVTGKQFAKKLYPRYKAILKHIKRELKHTAQLCKDGDREIYRQARQLYKAFKYLVYRSWKKRVKTQYQESKKDNDLYAWGWIHHQILIIEKI